MKTKHHGQMSESFLTAVFLSLSGGLQDAYTYLFRGKVFANAQTGNIVLLSTNIMDGRWDKVLHYLVPLCAFALGVLAAEKMREHFQAMQRLHWRQLVVLGEVLLLFAVGFLPQSQNLLANAIVSFSCAMQVQAFRKVNGSPPHPAAQGPSHAPKDSAPWRKRDKSDPKAARPSETAPAQRKPPARYGHHSPSQPPPVA